MKKPASASRAWEGLTPELSDWLLQAVKSMGFEKMTPVQATTIPLFTGNKDVVVEAVTGSGKTLAFLIPVIEKLLKTEELVKKYHVGALIVSPTRELAAQIHSVLLSVLGFHPPSAAAIEPQESEDEEQSFPSGTKKIVPQLVVGGSQTPAQDLAQFMENSPNVLVGTPGRLLELLSCRAVQCPQSSFEVLVLDEADRLLDLGFQDHLQKILQYLPKQRRTGLFSASMSEAVDQLIRTGLRNPVKISVKVKSESGTLDRITPVSLQMSYLVVKPTEKLPALSHLLENLNPTPQKTIVYLSTCAAVNYFQHVLPILLPNFTVVPLHGKQVPSTRERNFIKFTQSVTPSLLLTTNVAARGLDIPLVDLVVQIDPPSDPKVFIHRCGRAGRAGRKGLAVTFLTPGSEEKYVDYLGVRKTPIALLEDPHIAVSDEETKSVTAKIRDLVRDDRALHDVAQKAFVSWVQSYSKHEVASIFPVRELDWTEMGDAWGLLRLPSMPELKKWEGDRTLGVDIKFNEFKYKDKQKEKRRLEEATQPKEKRKKTKPVQTEAWSGKKADKADLEVRREKRRAKSDFKKEEKMTDSERLEKAKLDDLIKQVRERNARKAKEDEAEWKGFDD